MNRDLIYLVLIFCLLVVPRALQRFRIPAPVTSLVAGIVAVFVFGEETHDPVLALLSTIGISSLFLFAGLEVDPGALKRRWKPLLTHLAVRALSLFALGWLAWRFLDLGWQASGLLALALLTPSTGFILDTLERLGLDDEEAFWVTNKAIAGEIVALAALFVMLQAGDMQQLALSSAAMLALVIGVPLLFIALGRWVVPHAKGSEFSLLVMVGLVAAYVTYKLGVYYLVGAFIVGVIARLLHERMPKLASEENLHALRLFATFFVPIYFFSAGTHVPPSALGPKALAIGLVLTVVLLPLRIGIVWLQRRVMFGESSGSSMRVALALTPTLVFTLVLAGILYSRFGLPESWLGALVIYTVLNTMLPSLLLRTPIDLSPNAPGAEHPEDEVPDSPAVAPVEAGQPATADRRGA
ncbi:cation:proton antiporter [Lysobacter korlensis]|uniref:Cation:proton antiporter n=1 Tax=Lysobacter korlensis TaxID=553636 RepID=A0ABV6RSD7_9GAMM